MAIVWLLVDALATKGTCVDVRAGVNDPKGGLQVARGVKGQQK